MWVKISDAWINLAQVLYVKERDDLGPDHNEPGICIIFNGLGDAVAYDSYAYLELRGSDAEHVWRSLKEVAQRQWR